MTVPLHLVGTGGQEGDSVFSARATQSRAPGSPVLETLDMPDFHISPQRSVQSNPWSPNKDETGDGVGGWGLLKQKKEGFGQVHRV